MKYIDLVHTINVSAGAEDNESEEALNLVVENVASQLSERTRQGFAAYLPAELQPAAEAAPTITPIDEDIINQLMDIDGIDEHRARRQIRATWRVLRELFERDVAADIEAELPRSMKLVLG